MTIILREFTDQDSAAMTAYEEGAKEWLIINVGADSAEVKTDINSSRAVALALRYHIIRGSLWRLSKELIALEETKGDGWLMAVAYSATPVNEITVVIDDELLALQFKLAMS